MFGLAYGDALGKPTEFWDYDQIIRHYGPTGPLALESDPALSGDSDSIASIAGAFAGAAHGFAAWPADWAAQIEYHIELGRVGSAWD
jgi:ADP-ribosylglycohydrolase